MKFPLTLIPSNTKIDFISKRQFAFAFSILLTIATFIVVFTKSFNWGIDFQGGISIEIEPYNVTEVGKIREILSDQGYDHATIQSTDNYFLIRLQPKTGIDQKKTIEDIKNILNASLDNQLEFRRIDYVGPKVGYSLIKSGMLATFASLICMLVYICVRFNWQYGLGTVIALLHDALFTVGFYSLSSIEFDLTSIAAILTVIGYSINDSVVIFDRIRENLRRYKSTNIKQVINLSLNETLSRTVMTVATTLIVCLALVLFGGEVIYGFSIAVFVGIAFGTYSSIYIASPILLYTNIHKSQN